MSNESKATKPRFKPVSVRFSVDEMQELKDASESLNIRLQPLISLCVDFGMDAKTNSNQ